MTEGKGKSFGLYHFPLAATRGGALFNAHAYPTKIDPSAVALAIACHTTPGQTVFDGFGGSGTTALGALLCSNPPPELRERAAQLGLQPRWGTRRVIVYELSGLGTFIAETLTSRVNAAAFREAAKEVLSACESRYGWLYDAVDETGGSGEVRHIVWSDVLHCRECGNTVSLWEGCVTRSPSKIGSSFRCPSCNHSQAVDDAPRKIDERFDELLGKSVITRLRVPGQVYGVSGGRTWARDALPSDIELVARVAQTPVPPLVPVVPMRWGDLRRAGYHHGMSHVHHFYTRRNLIAVAAIRQEIDRAPAALRKALSFWLSSYNASHSTLMTRVVAKKGGSELVVTSNQPGVLYVSGLPVEKNVFRGLRRKLSVIERAFAEAGAFQGDVRVVQGSSDSTDLPDASVDYIFTDPPFGGNIPYSEANFISEAWLGRIAEQRNEAIVSQAQGKSLTDYGRQLEQCFAEFRRVLKPSGKATVVFHSSEAAVWQALVQSFDRSGFSVEAASILDKRQGSFKQVTAANAVKGDALLLLRPSRAAPAPPAADYIDVMRDLVVRAIAQGCPDESSPQRLYSRFINRYVQLHARPPLDADQFYAELTTHFLRHGQLSVAS